ncbi:HlyC/CorC family transporter [SAR202 cluster bacterium AD-802-E10_MRT_200m]|nr:HlyC/CorC family transporter [SAR202 cluster bacterium AD-802-E10_MRT_200m]MQF82773.1 HlyC/CorC family transporter [SAR202 cluster bacterium AD-802-E10_MRT_200m]
MDTERALCLLALLGICLALLIVSVAKLLLSEFRNHPPAVSESAFTELLEKPSMVDSSLLLWQLIFRGIGLVTIVFLLVEVSKGVSLWIFAACIFGFLTLEIILSYLIAQLVINRRPESGTLIPMAVIKFLILVCNPLLRVMRLMMRNIPGKNSSSHSNDSQEGEILIRIDEPINPPDAHELGMIEAILRLEENTVREVMVPRVDLLTFSVEDSVHEASHLLVRGGHTRAPVFDGDIDHIVGILHARDLLTLIDEGDFHIGLSELVRPVLFVPETKRLDELLPEFLTQHVHIAVVVDEYGGTSGLVTLEDILEQIVGEIVDEFSQEEPEIAVIDENQVLLNGKVSLDYLHERFDVVLEADGFDTIGGFVYDQLGKIPNPGEELVVGGLKIEVVSTVGRRITKIKVTRVPQP